MLPPFIQSSTQKSQRRSPYKQSKRCKNGIHSNSWVATPLFIRQLRQNLPCPCRWNQPSQFIDATERGVVQILASVTNGCAFVVAIHTALFQSSKSKWRPQQRAAGLIFQSRRRQTWYPFQFTIAVINTRVLLVVKLQWLLRKAVPLLSKCLDVAHLGVSCRLYLR